VVELSARFESAILDAARRELVLGVRAGNGDHKFTAVWPVVANDRIFARSWGLRPRGWRSVVARDRCVSIQVGGREMTARAVLVRSERVNAAVDDAYRAKYHTQASAKYVEDLTSGESRRSTVEFVPE